MTSPSRLHPCSLHVFTRAIALSSALMLGAASSSFAQTKVMNDGDSITFGVGASDGATKSYSPVLGTLLGSAYSVQRDGTGGATLLKRGQPSFFDTQGIPNTLAANPDIITILLGTNDSKATNWVYKDEFVGDYLSLIDTFRGISTNPKIFLCLPPPALDQNASDVRGSVIANEVIPRIFEAARQRDLRVIDLHTPFLDTYKTLFPDGIHPNDEGHRIIATQIRDAIVSGKSLRPVSSSWQRNAIGVGAIEGADAADDAGLVVVLGAGVAVGGASDACRFVSQSASGDFEITARVLGQRNMDPQTSTRAESSAGVMVRDGTAPDARFFSVFATAGNGISIRWRESSGANSGITASGGVKTPVWVRVRRVGNVFTGFYSSNGGDWKQLGQPHTIAFSGGAQAGVAANSGSADALTYARFESVVVSTLGSDTPVAGPDLRLREARRSLGSNGGTFRPDYNAAAH